MDSCASTHAADIMLLWSQDGRSSYAFRGGKYPSKAFIELFPAASGKGVGGRAACDIRAGDRLLAESPLLEQRLSDVSEESLRAAVNQMGHSQQLAFQALCVHGIADECQKTALGRWLSNAYPTDEQPEETGAVFRVACRLNHSCQPNARITWSGRLRRMTVHAIKEISAGEEILVCYAMELLEGGGSTVLRRATLRERFGFECQCQLCRHPAVPASDARRDCLWKNAAAIADCDGDVPALVEERLHLLMQEGLAPSVESMAVAFAYTTLAGDQDGARAWACRAAESARMQLGDDSDDYLRWTDDYLQWTGGGATSAESGHEDALLLALATFCIRTGVMDNQQTDTDEQLAEVQAQIEAAQAELAMLEGRVSRMENVGPPS